MEGSWKTLLFLVSQRLRELKRKAKSLLLPYSHRDLNGVILSETTKTPNRWKDAIRTLARLHRVDPASIGLSTFGKPTGFYGRQIVTFQTISESQARAVDVETKIPVGDLPHADEILNFFKDRTSQPKDRGTVIHGDYKIDNLVYHKTEPRVIGILE